LLDPTRIDALGTNAVPVRTPSGGGSEKDTFDRVVEVYRARMTIGLALLVGFVTVLGFGVEGQSHDLFLVAALVPVAALFVDTFLARSLVDPLFYRVLLEEEAKGETEGLGHVTLLFRGVSAVELSVAMEKSRKTAGERFAVFDEEQMDDGASCSFSRVRWGPRCCGCSLTSAPSPSSKRLLLTPE